MQKLCGQARLGDSSASWFSHDCISKFSSNIANNRHYSWYLADDCRSFFRRCCNPAQPQGVGRPHLHAQASPTLKPVFSSLSCGIVDTRHSMKHFLALLKFFLVLATNSNNGVGYDLLFFVLYKYYLRVHDRHFSLALPCFGEKTKYSILA